MSLFMTTSIVISTTIERVFVFIPMQNNIKCIFYSKLTEKIENPNVR